MQVAGVDIWKKRWVVAVVEDGRFICAHVAADAREAIDLVPDACVIAIDIPIGLPRLGRKRTADLLARKLVGPRLASSVFPAPAQVLVKAGTFAAANAIARREGCPGVSQQTYGLRAAILQVTPLVETDTRIYEVHPEVSFRLAKGGSLQNTKASWNGVQERHRILQAHRLIVPDDLGDAGAAGVADVLDSVACAWSAGRIASHCAVRLPAVSCARAPAIWG